MNLSRRVSIDRKAVSKDATFGAQTATWTLVATVFAERRDDVPSRVEATEQGLERSRNRIRYRIRYRTDIDSSMRIRDGAEIMQIVGGPARVGARNQYLELYCERITNQGA